MSYKKTALAFALLLAGSSVFSQALPVGVSPVFAPTVTSGGISYSGGVASSANASSITFSNAANGPVYGQAVQRVALGGGATADLTLRSAPSAANVAGAVGRFAVKAVGVLAVGVALYDLAKELGFDLGNSGGSVVVTKANPALCTAGPCYSWSVIGRSPAVVVTSTAAYCASVVGLTYYGVRIAGCSAGAVQSDGRFSTSLTLANGGSGSDMSSYGNIRSPDLPVGLPATVQEFQDAIAAKSGWPATSAINRAINDAIASGEVIPLPQPSTITGPGAVPLSPSVITLPDGSTITKTPTKVLSYSPPSVAVSDSVVEVAKDPAGNTTSTTGTQAPTEMPETCGYPGGPPCKIDETGTPEQVAKKVYDPLADAVKSSMDTGTTTMAGTADKAGLFSGWSMFWSAPAVVQCAPYQLPNWNGQSMGSLDPCGVVDGVRTVMAYIWSLAGLMMCLGFVRESIQQG